jgi:hypothetical protein
MEWVAIGINDGDEIFIAETSDHVLIEYRNYDSSYFDGQEVETDENGRKYYVMRDWHLEDFHEDRIRANRAIYEMGRHAGLTEKNIDATS